MPLHDLVNYFNQRFAEEHGIHTQLLHYDGAAVIGQFGQLNIASQFRVIREIRKPEFILGLDAHIRGQDSHTHADPSDTEFFTGMQGEQVINLDRLIRTVHMLNFLPMAHEKGSIFLQVHPRHILGVKRDHGAYFEEIIFKCGLSPAKVVISVLITPLYNRQFKLLLDGLRNYRERGYGTAIKFDEQAQPSTIDAYCIEFLHRFTPDYVRFDSRYFGKPEQIHQRTARKSALPKILRSLDTSFLMDGINTADDASQALLQGADFITGNYYEADLNTDTAQAA